DGRRLAYRRRADPSHHRLPARRDPGWVALGGALPGGAVVWRIDARTWYAATRRAAVRTVLLSFVLRRVAGLLDARLAGTRSRGRQEGRRGTAWLFPSLHLHAGVLSDACDRRTAAADRALHRASPHLA